MVPESHPSPLSLSRVLFSFTVTYSQYEIEKSRSCFPLFVVNDRSTFTYKGQCEVEGGQKIRSRLS